MESIIEKIKTKEQVAKTRNAIVQEERNIILENAKKYLNETEYQTACKLQSIAVLKSYIDFKVEKKKLELEYLKTICYMNDNEIQFCMVDENGRTSYQLIDRVSKDESIKNAAERLKKIVGRYAIYYCGTRY